MRPSSEAAGNLNVVTQFQRCDLLFATLLVLFVLLSYNASRQESVTIDEFRHLPTGIHYWQSGDYSFDPATPPLWKMAMSLPAYLSGVKPVQFRQLPETAAGWEPWFVATDFMRDNDGAYDGYLQAARLVNLLAAVLCLVLLYRRCRGRFGPGAALFGTAFLALSPTFLAHSHYATTDIIATLTVTATVFLLGDYLRRPSSWGLAGATLLFSLSLLCKFSVLILAPMLFAVPLAVSIMAEGKSKRRFAGLAAALVVVTVIPLVTVNVFYGFRGTGTPLRQMHLESRSLAALSRSGAGDVPLPLPRGFVEGFDRQKADSDYSEFPAYLRGEWSVDGFRSYYLTAFILKESIPFLVLLAAALVMLFRWRAWDFSRSEMLLLLYVPIVLFLVLSFMNRLNVGVRYLLPAYPFLCLSFARLYRELADRRGAWPVLVLLLGLHTVSVLRISPHYTAYFNECAGGPAHGYRYLIDSNIDWGQDLSHLKRYLADHGVERIQLAYFGHGLPEHYGIDYEPLSIPPRPGYAAISVSLLQGQPYLLTYLDPPRFAEMGQFRFMREREPVGRAGYSLLIYRFD